MPKLLFLGCNHDQVPYLKALEGRGYTIFGTDMNLDPPGKIYCDKVLPIGYDNLEALISLGEQKGFTKVDKVFTASSQFAQLGAATFAAHFGINYPSVEAVELCLDKTKYYEYFKSHGIPLPKTTYATTEAELKRSLSSAERSERFYLKSDFSKNPKYVYTFSAGDVPWGNIFWGRDRYLRSKYILQREFPGVSLRINIYGDRFNVYDFENGQKTQQYHKTLVGAKVISTLRQLINELDMGQWLLKFDVILAGDEFAVLDIGLDPPYRMVQSSRSTSINFAKHYLDQYLLGQVTYPTSLD